MRLLQRDSNKLLPSFSFGTAFKPIKPSETPGPNSYMPAQASIDPHHAVSIGARLTDRKLSLSPGPQYSLPSTRDGPKHRCDCVVDVT